MKHVTVLCDNHPDREAVATYSVAKLSVLGYRPVLPNVITAANVYDLCEECVSLLGWSPDEREPEMEEIGEENISDGQRRLLFARCREIGITEPERHELIEAVTGQPSSRYIARKDFDRIVDALDAEASRRA